MTLRTLIIGVSALLAAIYVLPAAAQDANGPVVRIAELEIDPAQMHAYSAAVKVEMDESIRVEPGVLALYAVSIKGKPNHLRFFEIYVDEAAYLAHRDSAHFQEYVASTKRMIVNRKLIETDNFQLSAKP